MGKKDLEVRKSPKQKRAEETVEALLEATAQVLVESGYSKASTNRIAKRAGVSIGSLYQYFPNKDALILALLDRHVNAQMEILTSRIAETDWLVHTLSDRVRVLIDALVYSHRAQMGLTQELFEQIPRTGELDRVRFWTDRAVCIVEGVFIAQKESFKIRDPKMAAYILVHAFEGIMSRAVMSHPELLESEAFMDELCALVLGYIA